ncbi:hypothetical protein [Pseudomonas sp. HS6]|uniref:hypothetical protein n=1 Tax=Pseudomonas sp. HS6 TaxID=2850559 RepID=UPI0020186872|nr:hypothetical protein [Pseudomonas sp. HS6]
MPILIWLVRISSSPPPAWTLGANLENLFLTGSDNLNGVGNGLNNYLVGNSGNNVLSGGAGDDTLDGAATTKSAPTRSKWV